MIKKILLVLLGILVVLQFTISQALIIGVLIVIEIAIELRMRVDELPDTPEHVEVDFWRRWLFLLLGPLRPRLDSLSTLQLPLRRRVALAKLAHQL